jgi:hypothetical protein
VAGGINCSKIEGFSGADRRAARDVELAPLLGLSIDGLHQTDERRPRGLQAEDDEWEKEVLPERMR